MKKIITLLAIAAMSAFIMISCSGNGSSKKGVFGSLPEVYAQFEQEKEQLENEAETITTEAEKAKLMEKYKKMLGKWRAQIEKSAKALDGKVLTLAESDIITVSEPLSLQYDGFFMDSEDNDDLIPVFTVNGKAEAPTDIITGRRTYLKNPTEVVRLVGYNAEGKEVCGIRIGYLKAENRDGYSVVPAGTPVDFETISGLLKPENHKAIQTLKLELEKEED